MCPIEIAVHERGPIRWMRLAVDARETPCPADDGRIGVDEYADRPLADASDCGRLAVDVDEPGVIGVGCGRIAIDDGHGVECRAGE